jgi:hypothetical protein
VVWFNGNLLKVEDFSLIGYDHTSFPKKANVADDLLCMVSAGKPKGVARILGKGHKGI